jgi:hypothetical protein
VISGVDPGHRRAGLWRLFNTEGEYEMSSEESIYVEDLAEEASQDAGAKRRWTEELKVSGEELLSTVRRLVEEAGVRRIIVRSKNGKNLIEIPMALGVAGIALLPVYSALAVMAALVTECTILVERTDEPKKGD